MEKVSAWIAVSVLLGDGDGTFRAARNFAAGAYAISVATGDFNGDGVSDLAVANLNSHTVSVLLGNGDGTFQSPWNFEAGIGPHAVVVSDFNRDGRADLAIATGRYSPRTNGMALILINGTR
jgi:hypothetical protein